MNRPYRAITAGVCAAMALAAAALSGQTPAPSMPRAQALLILRSINTAEAETSRTEKQYVGLPKLVQHAVFTLPELQSVRMGAALAPDGGPIPVGSYALRLEPSASGRRYTVSLIGEISCSVSWFSDERGTIYEGKAIGCDEK